MTKEIIIHEKSALASQETYPIGMNPAMVYIASLQSEHSRRVMKQTLRSIVATIADVPVQDITLEDAYAFQWHNLRYQHTTALRTKLADTMNFRTVNRCLSALRRVLKECWRLEYMDNETMARACDIQNIKGETVPAGRSVPQGQIQALATHCYEDTNEALGIRDNAILAILYTSGVRRAELAGLELKDYMSDEIRLHIRSGKGNKERFVYLPQAAGMALSDWIEIRGNKSGSLFLRVLKNGNIKRDVNDGKLKGISSQALYNMLQNRAKQAGIPEFTPHDLRRSFVSDALDKGIDINTVSKIAGHANVSTTARYDRRDERSKQAAASFMHYPYRPRTKLI